MSLTNLGAFRLGCLLAGGLWLTGIAWSAPASVILISIDTLRADHLSAYGYNRIQTPHIDSYGSGGTVFTNVAAQVPLTLPSHYSLFTSTYPFQTQIEENAERVPGGSATLAGVLQARGYNTAGFIGSVFLERQLGIDQGFDFYDSPFSFQAFSPISGSMFFAGAGRNPYSVRDRRDAAVVLRAARQWLAANRDQSVFAFIHLFDLHRPYSPHAVLAARRDLSGYDTELTYVDQLLGSFQQWLIKEGWWDHSLVVLLSDHGESLGEHGEASHGYFIYQSTLWVPLLAHWPAGGQGHAAQVKQPFGLMDVAPTILDFLGVAPPASFEGKSQLAAARTGGTSEPAAVYGESVHAHDSFGWAPLRSLRLGRYKYIEAPRPELYNLESDPHEQKNLIQSNPAEARAMKEQIGRLLARYAPKRPASPSQISPQTRALLGSLGYLSSGPKGNPAAAGADPKDRLPEFRLYEEAQTSLYHGQLVEATTTLQHLLARDPKNLLARRDLGGCYIEQQLYRQALRCFRQVLDVTPDDYVANYEMAIAEEHLGFFHEAVGHVQAACKAAPEAAQCLAELEKLKQKVR